MKSIEYINNLIKEKENLKTLCKSHVETIRMLKKDIVNLNITITKKDKKIQKLESEYNNSNIENVKNELVKLREDYADLQSKYNEVEQKNEKPNVKSQRDKNGLSKLKSDYNELKHKYEDVLKKNEELMRIFDEISKTCDSD